MLPPARAPREGPRRAAGGSQPRRAAQKWYGYLLIRKSPPLYRFLPLYGWVLHLIIRFSAQEGGSPAALARGKPHQTRRHRGPYSADPNSACPDVWICRLGRTNRILSPQYRIDEPRRGHLAARGTPPRHGPVNRGLCPCRTDPVGIRAARVGGIEKKTLECIKPGFLDGYGVTAVSDVTTMLKYLNILSNKMFFTPDESLAKVRYNGLSCSEQRPNFFRALFRTRKTLLSPNFHQG